MSTTAAAAANERQADDADDAGCGAIAVDDERDVRGRGRRVCDEERDAQAEIRTEQPRASVDESRQREARGRLDGVDADRLAFEGARRFVRGQQHVEHAALDEKHQHGRCRQRDAERDGERHERRRLGGQRGRRARRDVTQPALEQFREIGADDDRRGARRRRE